MCAIIRDQSLTPISVNKFEAKAISSLNEVLYTVLPVRSPESRERLLFLLTPEAQQQIATKISDEENIQVDNASVPAVAAWKRIEYDFFNSIQMDKSKFINHIASVVSGEIIPKELCDICNCCRGIVQSVEWVNVFAWQMPIMKPELSEEYFDMARIIGGIYYLERYSKLTESALISLSTERVTDLLRLIFESNVNSNTHQ